jgi:hypothetical protein
LLRSEEEERDENDDRMEEPLSLFIVERGEMTGRVAAAVEM